MSLEENLENSREKNKTKQEKVSVTKNTRKKLHPLDYSVAMSETGRNLEKLNKKLEFQKRLNSFIKLTQENARQNFYQKTGKNISKIPQNFQESLKKSLGQNPKLDLEWQKLVRFDRTNKIISGAVLVGDFMYGGLSARLKKAKQSKNNFAKKSLSVLKPYLIANIIAQPLTLAVAGMTIKGAKNVVYHGGGMVKNVVYGTVSGDLLKEVKNLGKGGDPIEYLWNGKTYKKRQFESLKNPHLYSTPEKLKPYFGNDLRNFYNSFENYKTKPAEVRENIPKMSEFVFRSAKSSMTQLELQNFLTDLKNGVWDEKKVQKAMMMSASGGMLKFFMETATSNDRQNFVQNLKSLSNRKFPPRKFSEKEIATKISGINKSLTKKEKSGIRSLLGLGFTGIAASVFLLTSLLGKLLSSNFMTETFEFFTIDGPSKVFKKIGKNLKKQKKKTKTWTNRQWEKFSSFLNNKKGKETIKSLGGKKGVLTKEQTEFLNGKSVSKIERNKIMKDLKKWSKNKSGLDKKYITSEEFWKFDSLKNILKKED